MKESRFRISHVFLVLFLLSCAACFVHLIIMMIDLIRYHHWAFSLYYIVLIPLLVLCLWAAFGIVTDDIKHIKNGESTSLYAEEKK